MKRTTALMLTLCFALATPAFGQSKNKVRKGKSTPKVEQTPRTESLDSNQTSPTGADAPNTADPLTSTPAEPLPPMDTPPAPPMDADTAKSGKNHIGANVQLGIPRLAGLGLNFVTLNERLSFELAGGSASMSSDNVKVNFSSFDLAARYHVFGGAFFLGAALGQQTLSGEGTDTVQAQNVTVKIDIKTMYLTPQLGWMAGKADGGFFFETVLGFQNPMSTTVDFSSNAPGAVQNDPEYVDLDRKVRDDGKKIGEIGMPLFAIKIGYLF
ncbi:MAG: hypothetical protein KF767_02525 [Bdellovibrionaceae bacterium]|nr:hypothetical protein [Pseudobdellovibrionaceae bacterium]